jgi:hypothetical protein
MLRTPLACAPCMSYRARASGFNSSIDSILQVSAPLRTCGAAPAKYGKALFMGVKTQSIF